MMREAGEGMYRNERQEELEKLWYYKKRRRGTRSCIALWLLLKKEEDDGGAGRRIYSLRSVGELAGWRPDGGASEGEGTDVEASGKLGLVPRGLLC